MRVHVISDMEGVVGIACEYVVQQEWTEYTRFLESGCDAALFVGMHAMAGTADGVLSHTVSGRAWQSLSFFF